MSMKTPNFSRLLTVFVLFLSFFYLLCHPHQAAASAGNGLLLWYRSVLPVLFPFMLLCGILTRLDLSEGMPGFLVRPLHFLFGCSEYGAFIILTGFLCGFPMGAKLTSDLYKRGKISRREALCLHGFVNNLSPAFILSYLAAGQMGIPALGLPCLMVILGSSMIYGICICAPLRRKAKSSVFHFSGTETAVPKESIVLPPSETETAGDTLIKGITVVDESLNDSIWNVVRLGGYIVAFSVISSGIAAALPPDRPFLLFLASCIEVTGGIRLICQSSLHIYSKFILTCTLGAFGGLSALLQTITIAGLEGPFIRQYIKSRVKITLLAMALSMMTVLLFFCIFRN